MMNKLLLYSISTIFFSISVLAQETPLLERSSAPYVRHVGVPHGWSIGSKETPVHVEEFCNFLNHQFNEYHRRDLKWTEWLKECLAYNVSLIENFNKPGLCDGYIINTSSGWWYNTVPILRTQKSDYHYFWPGDIDARAMPGEQSYGFVDSYFVYSVKSDCKNMIIDSVSSQGLQEAFNEWREKQAHPDVLPNILIDTPCSEKAIDHSVIGEEDLIL